MITQADIEKRFAHHPPKHVVAQSRHEQVRAILKDAALRLLEITTSSREQSLMVTKLEEAMFHANADIARNQQ